MLIKQGERLINARNWSELVKPDQISREEETASSTHGKFVCEPLERGYGTTIGNALRRVLLSSLQGAAFVSVKITGVQHEFTTIHGVLEDVTDVILNIKQVRLAMDTDEPQRLVLRADAKGPVTAAQIQGNQHCCDDQRPQLFALVERSFKYFHDNDFSLRAICIQLYNLCAQVSTFFACFLKCALKV